MRAVVLLTLFLLSGSCTDGAEGDAGVHADIGSPDTGRIGIDACRPWECPPLSYTCVAGTVYSSGDRVVEVPCDVYRGVCPLGSPIHTCARGCTTDGGFASPLGGPLVDPRSLCVEDQPRDAGEFCSGDAGCGLPIRIAVDGGGLGYRRLACDPDAGVCVDIPAPMPADFGSACAVDLSALPVMYGAVADLSCSGGLCAFSETSCSGCTIPCADDWDCPDGLRCAARPDWSSGPDAGPGPFATIKACGTPCLP